MWSSARRSTPNSLAMVDIVAEAETPMISHGGAARDRRADRREDAWVFKTPQNDSLMADADRRRTWRRTA